MIVYTELTPINNKVQDMMNYRTQDYQNGLALYDFYSLQSMQLFNSINDSIIKKINNNESDEPDKSDEFI